MLVERAEAEVPALDIVRAIDGYPNAPDRQPLAHDAAPDAPIAQTMRAC